MYSIESVQHWTVFRIEQCTALSSVQYWTVYSIEHCTALNSVQCEQGILACCRYVGVCGVRVTWYYPFQYWNCISKSLVIPTYLVCMAVHKFETDCNCKWSIPYRHLCVNLVMSLVEDRISIPCLFQIPFLLNQLCAWCNLEVVPWTGHSHYVKCVPCQMPIFGVQPGCLGSVVRWFSEECYLPLYCYTS